MNLNPARTRDYLKQFNFKALFVNELGWNNPPASLPVSAEGQNFTLQAVAEKGGMVVYRCNAPDGHIPPYNLRRKIEQAAAKRVREHIIIYTDDAQTTQVWQWVKREAGKPLASREHTFHRNQSGDGLIQKLDALVFTLPDEELGIGILDPVLKTHAGFDVEKVTKKFYDRFKAEHDRFLKFMDGIPDDDLAKWYVSVMLNRLMFIYFIQKKGFLDGDTNYLRNRLSASKKQRKDRFYQEFLCPLFFLGFAQRERTAALRQQFGIIPYLNGGLFTEHYIEQLHGKTIAIPDSAFENIFAFFDEYQWHLDDRPTRDDKEINPDVLGYVFEKYINQKQMGAYYTKEDITGYISQNTILPFLFDAARNKTSKVSETFEVLKQDPDRYIYDAVKHGATLDLPANIAAGIPNVAKRTEWNKPAPAEYALPTEIWREVVARRQRYQDVRAKLANGEITGINDFITYNLNIRQFARDAIANVQDPDVLRAFWHALEKISVLDPTVGSGAFLFAALNILEDLYEACLDRMAAFVYEADKTFGVPETPRVSNPAFQKFSDFRAVLDRVAQHPNRPYFIYKSIIVNNLYGVDIMEEAVEICKLRLFLKLVAQVDDPARIEPLPDIDFNIRAGNTLVGFATREQVKQALTFGKAGQMRMVSTEEDARMARIDELAEIADRAFQQFRAQQTEHGGVVTPEHKAQLRARFKVLEDELNALLASQYGVNPKSKTEYDRWLKSHEPFHWFIEFYGILNRGGFDVIIGNPPYVEYGKIKKDYSIRGYETEECGNLYAFVIERNASMLSPRGRTGMIIPHSAFCTDRMASLMNLFKHRGGLWVSHYDIRPAKLFVGVDQRLAIYLQDASAKDILYSTKYNRWNEEARIALFETLSYASVGIVVYENALAKMGNPTELHLWHKVSKQKPAALIGASRIYFHNAPRYWIRAMTFAPYFWNERDGEQLSTQVKPLFFSNKSEAAVAAAILNSSLYYWWFVVLSDSRHLNMREIERFPFGLETMRENLEQRLATLIDELMQDYKKNKYRKEAEYQATGKVIYDEYYPRFSKPIIDQIDRVLAQHYGFTDEELDFIINYDIKYRMGKDGGEEEE